MFCEHVQHILDELMAGNLSALSQFMHTEMLMLGGGGLGTGFWGQFLC